MPHNPKPVPAWGIRIGKDFEMEKSFNDRRPPFWSSLDAWQGVVWPCAR